MTILHAEIAGTALERIIAYKQDEVSVAKSRVSDIELRDRATSTTPARGFFQAIEAVTCTGENGLICELKRRSPSAGEILPGADPVIIAREYEAGGAACLSVLTDGPSFGGHLDDLVAIRRAVALPLLRKDFMIDPYQVLEARAFGADAVLVIMAALSDTLARDIYDSAMAYGMDVLVEVHNRRELERALTLPTAYVGINNRNLKSMTTDLAVTERLCKHMPPGKRIVAESGISTVEDIIRLRKTGAQQFLIGESLMKQTDRQTAVHALRVAGSN